MLKIVQNNDHWKKMIIILQDSEYTIKNLHTKNGDDKNIK